MFGGFSKPHCKMFHSVSPSLVLTIDYIEVSSLPMTSKIKKVSTCSKCDKLVTQNFFSQYCFFLVSFDFTKEFPTTDERSPLKVPFK